MLLVNLHAPERLAAALAIALMAEAPGLDRGATFALRALRVWGAVAPGAPGPGTGRRRARGGVVRAVARALRPAAA